MSKNNDDFDAYRTWLGILEQWRPFAWYDDSEASRIERFIPERCAMYRLLFAFFLLATSSFAEDVQLTPDNYEKWKKFILPSERELAYRQIPWKTNLNTALAEGKSKNKPILLWAYNGSPLGQGCYNAIVTKNLFENDKIQRLSKEFIPVADCSWKLDSIKDYPGHEVFRKASPQGGQDFYVLTPGGQSLGRSHLDYNNVINLLESSLEKWKTIPEEKSAARSGKPKPEDKFYPSNGLVLHSYVRDLPHFSMKRDGPQWNHDFAWFLKNEARYFVPPVIKPDQEFDVASPIVERLVRFSFVDCVHGMTSPYDKKDIKVAKLKSRVKTVDHGIADIEFSGESKTEAMGVWNYKEHHKNTEITKRGFSAKILGKAQYNVSEQKFVMFELVACGTRYGATEFNFRDNLEESPIGVVLVLAGKDESEKVPPVFFNNYKN